MLHDHRAGRLYLLGEMVREMIIRAEGRTGKVSSEMASEVRSIREVGQEAGLSVTLYTVDRLLDYLKKPKGLQYREAVTQLNVISNSIEAELHSFKFLRIEAADAKYYQDKQLFGEDVASRFPTATQDVEEAGKCLALSRGTATVFHLMRVMESGLKALAKALDIPYAPSWESYIKQIETKISEKHKHKGIKWKRDEPFFREVLGNLQTIKIAWRNPTMHIVRQYTPEEADDIFRAVRSFMRKISGRIGETKA